jgi:hypothetical protein
VSRAAPAAVSGSAKVFAGDADGSADHSAAVLPVDPDGRGCAPTGGAVRLATTIATKRSGGNAWESNPPRTLTPDRRI